MKKGIIIGIVIGIAICGLSVYAATIASSSVSYDNKNSGSTATNVQGALDDLYENSYEGKIKIAQAITNKGINTSETDSYDTIVSNINNISTGNPNLRYNEETSYVQALDTNGSWINIYYALSLPLSKIVVFDGGTDYPYILNDSYTTVDTEIRTSQAGGVHTLIFKTPIDVTKYKSLNVEGYGFSGAQSNSSYDISSLKGEYYVCYWWQRYWANNVINV